MLGLPSTFSVFPTPDERLSASHGTDLRWWFETGIRLPIVELRVDHETMITVNLKTTCPVKALLLTVSSRGQAASTCK